MINEWMNEWMNSLINQWIIDQSIDQSINYYMLSGVNEGATTFIFKDFVTLSAEQPHKW